MVPKLDGWSICFLLVLMMKQLIYEVSYIKKCAKLKAWRRNNHTVYLIYWMWNMIYFACSLPCQITSKKDMSFKYFVVGCNAISVTMLIFVLVLICCDFELIYIVSHLSTSSLVILELLYVLCMIFNFIFLLCVAGTYVVVEIMLNLSMRFICAPCIMFCHFFLF